MRYTDGITLALLAVGIVWWVQAFGSPGGNPVNGKLIYEKNCAACHGSRGQGDGYTKFNPPVADLASSTIQRKEDTDLIKTIREGRPNTAMGSWRLVLSEQEIRDVVAYIRTFKEKS